MVIIGINPKTANNAVDVILSNKKHPAHSCVQDGYVSSEYLCVGSLLNPHCTRAYVVFNVGAMVCVVVGYGLAKVVEINNIQNKVMPSIAMNIPPTTPMELIKPITHNILAMLYIESLSRHDFSTDERFTLRCILHNFHRLLNPTHLLY